MGNGLLWLAVRFETCCCTAFIAILGAGCRIWMWSLRGVQRIWLHACKSQLSSALTGPLGRLNWRFSCQTPQAAGCSISPQLDERLIRALERIL